MVCEDFNLDSRTGRALGPKQCTLSCVACLGNGMSCLTQVCVPVPISACECAEVRLSA